jgi:hypothetical protein
LFSTFLGCWQAQLQGYPTFWQSTGNDPFLPLANGRFWAVYFYRLCQTKQTQHPLAGILVLYKTT